MVGEELCQGETLCTHFWLFFSAPGFCSDSSSLGKEGKAHIVGVKRIRELEKMGRATRSSEAASHGSSDKGRGWDGTPPWGFVPWQCHCQ